MFQVNFFLNGKNVCSVKLPVKIKYPEYQHLDNLVHGRLQLLTYNGRDDVRNSYFPVDIANQIKENLAHVLKNGSYDYMVDRDGYPYSNEGLNEMVANGRIWIGGKLEIQILDVSVPLYNKEGKITKEKMTKHLFTTEMDISNYLNVANTFKYYTRSITNVCQNVDMDYTLLDVNRFDTVWH